MSRLKEVVLSILAVLFICVIVALIYAIPGRRLEDLVLIASLLLNACFIGRESRLM